MDEGILALAQRKLRLDAAVLGALSASAATEPSPAAETGAMSELLAALLAESSTAAASLDHQAEAKPENKQLPCHTAQKTVIELD